MSDYTPTNPAWRPKLKTPPEGLDLFDFDTVPHKLFDLDFDLDFQALAPPITTPHNHECHECGKVGSFRIFGGNRFCSIRCLERNQ